MVIMMVVVMRSARIIAVVAICWRRWGWMRRMHGIIRRRRMVVMVLRMVRRIIWSWM